MKNIIKKIYTILILISNVLIRRKRYTLHFFSEEDVYGYKRWYYDFKHWGFQKEELEMVAGADNLCEFYSRGNSEVTVKIIATNKPIKNEEGYDKYEAETAHKELTFIESVMYGRNYNRVNENKIITMWICPVTIFVLGRYPKYIYVKNGI